MAKKKCTEARTKAMQHMIAWTIQNLYKTHADAKEILDNKDLSDAEKVTKLREPNGPDFRMVNLVLALKPAIEIAKEEYPEQTSFFEWFDDRWKVLTESNIIQGECGCKGCKKDE